MLPRPCRRCRLGKKRLHPFRRENPSTHSHVEGKRAFAFSSSLPLFFAASTSRMIYTYMSKYAWPFSTIQRNEVSKQRIPILTDCCLYTHSQSNNISKNEFLTNRSFNKKRNTDKQEFKKQAPNKEKLGKKTISTK